MRTDRIKWALGTAVVVFDFGESLERVADEELHNCPEERYARLTFADVTEITSESPKIVLGGLALLAAMLFLPFACRCIHLRHLERVAQSEHQLLKTADADNK